MIRPRLQGSMMLRVTTMEILKLSHWNPAKNMKTVLIDIKEFLQTWARLDFKSERNDRSRYPDGAYIDIEHHLLRLALVSFGMDWNQLKTDGLILEGFSLSLKPPKKVPNYFPQQYWLRKKMLKIVILYLFLRFEPKCFVFNWGGIKPRRSPKQGS